LYDETAALESPERDQFVILISRHDHMPLTSGFTRDKAQETGTTGTGYGYIPWWYELRGVHVHRVT
jgi:hypothetical protein